MTGTLYVLGDYPNPSDIPRPREFVITGMGIDARSALNGESRSFDE
jgi:hypothetical protein